MAHPFHPASQMCEMKDLKKLRYKYIIQYRSTYKQNKTPQKIEVKTSSFRGLLFDINRLMSRVHRTSGKNPASCPLPADPRAREDPSAAHPPDL